MHYFGYSRSQENITEYSQDTPTAAVPLLLAPILARLYETAMAMRVKLLESTLLNTLDLLTTCLLARISPTKFVTNNFPRKTSDVRNSFPHHRNYSSMMSL